MQMHVCRTAIHILVRVTGSSLLLHNAQPFT